jgi:hypothetical protein
MNTTTTETTTTTNVNALRIEYKRIAIRSEQTPEIFNAAVRDMLARKGIKNPSPAQMVRAARRVAFPCARCGGTGLFVTMVVNGRPTGPGGICYRCGGKGEQTDADRRRNFGYDVHMPCSV